MKINAKTDYACRALLELALHWPKKDPLQMDVIAHKQHIPVKFLIHILIHLKQAGLVESIRGKSGGYRLSISPKEVSIKDVVQAFDKVNILSNSRSEVMSALWKKIDEEVSAVVGRINFEELANKQKEKDKFVTFDI